MFILLIREKGAQQATPHLFPSLLQLPILPKADLRDKSGEPTNSSLPSPNLETPGAPQGFALRRRAGLQMGSRARAPCVHGDPGGRPHQALLAQTHHPVEDTPSRNASARRGQAPGPALRCGARVVPGRATPPKSNSQESAAPGGACTCPRLSLPSSSAKVGQAELGARLGKLRAR